MKTQTYRQGDILLQRVESMPKGVEKQVKNKSIVLGEGETIGHRHEILEVDKVEAYKSAEGFYLDVNEDVQLVHPEHAQVALEPGTYRVIRQHNYERKELQRVQD